MLANGRNGEIANDVLDARYFKALDRFDIRFARTMWVYDNVRPKSNLLHIGCGSGLLALLKRKEVQLAGIDSSEEAAIAARRNGYDSAAAADAAQLPFADNAFDYVVGFDVLDDFGESRFENALREIKRVLRPDGVILQAITGGEETSDAHYAARFLNFFQHVAYEPRHAVCSSAEDLLSKSTRDKQPLDQDLIEYLRELSAKERRAFDVAMGYVFGQLSDLNIGLPRAGTNILLKASDAPLGPFYNEHRDRRSLLTSNWTGNIGDGCCLDRNGDAVFDDGWHEPRMLPPVARWMGKQARIKFAAPRITGITLDLMTQFSDLAAQPLGLEILLDQVRVSALAINKPGWIHLNLIVPEQKDRSGEHELELHADRTVRAQDLGLDLADREVSIAVCNIIVHS